ncbi:MAG: CAP domain-containing protein [Methylococcaceae bacterium]|nr:CAP domain-containing protein [Methylococcaceae bacterium]
MKKILLSLLFLAPTWANAVCNSTYTLPNNEWHLISLPCTPGNNNTVADVLGDDISGTLGEDWAIFKFDATIQSYKSLASTDVVEQGRGYWVIHYNETNDSSVELDMPPSSTATGAEQSAQCSSENGCFNIPLHASQNEIQLNMLGYPYTNNHAWNTTQIVTNGSCQSPACTVNQASSDDKNILENKVSLYVANQGYITVNNSGELTPWSGFWVTTLENASEEGQPQLLIPIPTDSVIDEPSTDHPIPEIAEIDKLNILALINQARSQARSCGSSSFSAVPAVTWSNKLYKAAYEHSQDLAISNTFSHSGSGTESDWSGFALNKQSDVSDRLATYGYNWNSYGENIAAGQRTLEDAIQGWIDSPGHCQNIMSSDVTEIGMAKVINSSSNYEYYWTQVFSRQR